MAEEIKLPKNIRQIGEREEKVKIYMEDYVNTYIRRLKVGSDEKPRVGILVGTRQAETERPYLFIIGALEVYGSYMEEGAVRINEMTWAAVYDKLDKFFPQRAICGWFYCCREEEEADLRTLFSTHDMYFRGGDKVLFLYRENEEENFYLGRISSFEKLKGFNIYYERNEQMQDYLISVNPQRHIEEPKEEPVMQNFRSVMQQQKEKSQQRKSSGFAASAAMLLLATAVVTGSYMLKNNKLEAVFSDNVEQTFPSGSGTSVSGSGISESGGSSGESAPSTQGQPGESQGVVIEEVPGNVFPTEAPSTETPTEAPTEAPETQAPDPQPEQTAPPETNAPETPPATEAAAVSTYIVQSGDTLSIISKKIYGDDKHVQALCDANGITNPDFLYVGQELTLP